MNHIMVDLETFGVGANAVILSIGAVYFDKQGTTDKFYIAIDPKSCVKIGMEIEPDRVMWWMQQSKAARQGLTEGGVVSIEEALTKFANFVDADTKIWGNGSEFDNAKLENAYRKLDMKIPWDFWNNRCYRTVKNMFGDIQLQKRTGTRHNALDDAISQADHLIDIIHAKGIKLC